MKKIVAATIAAFAISLVSAPVAGAVTSASEPTVVQVKKSDYSKKRQNAYWRGMKRLDSDVLIIGKKDTIEMGTLVCDLLRAGGTLYDLAELASEADPLIEDLVIASMAAAPVYLCPDQQYKFD